MPLAVTHVILTIILVDLFRDYILKKHKKYFTLHTILIAGIAGLLPDLDYIIKITSEISNISFPFLIDHRGILHTHYLHYYF